MSDILKIRGIVLKETAVGEADKFITVLAKDYGKISVSVNGAKRVRKGLRQERLYFLTLTFTYQK